MMSIGEFAGMTGLSVSALRHYDEKGVLTPSEVDAQTGYRRYDEGQVRAGVVIRALRDAGVPLPEVASAAANGPAERALAAHRDRVLAEREREDRAFASAAHALAALAVPVDVVERRRAPQPWVGSAIPVPRREAEALNEETATALANERFARLFEALRDAGLGPSGGFWTTLRAGEPGAGDAGTIEIVCCWPTAVAVDPGWGGPDTVVGMLPARTELVATWRPGDDEEPLGSTTHPAVVALFDAIAERGLELRATEVRQIVLGPAAGDEEGEHAVEVAVTVTEL